MTDITDIIELELPSGRIVVAEAYGAGGAFRALGAGERLRRKLTDVADELRETLSVIAEQLENLTPRQPDKIAIELAVDIASGGAIKILAGDVKGGLKVSLTWEAKQKADKVPT